MDSHKVAFKEEAYELLAELETSLLELEEDPDDIEQVGRVFRAMHTIKGSGAMFGFDNIAAFTHNIESVFDLVREGRIQVTKELVNLTLDARDHIMEMLDLDGTDQVADEEKEKEITSALQELIPEDKTEETLSSDELDQLIEANKPEKKKVKETFRIRFKPEPQIFLTGTNPVLLMNELREMGECVVTAHNTDIPLLHEMDAESCYIYWDITITTSETEDSIRDVFIFVEDNCELTIDKLDEDYAPENRLGEILLNRGDISKEDLDDALEKQSKLGEILMDKKNVSKAAVKSALGEQKHVRKKAADKSAAVSASSIRVSAEKLDQLIDLVGELVTVQASLSQKAAIMHDPGLITIAEEVERLTSGLRENAMSIRMLPIGTTFSNFKRLVRDLANELGKTIELTTEGGETELDKTVIERLKDPLVHIIRNSIDHGLEVPEERLEAGKPETGTIQLSAKHSGANVLIIIRDDGRGLDGLKIRQKAESQGIVTPDEELTKSEVFNLIFAPGFSTAETVTDLSGRGVGMDVVKKSIEELRGSIFIDSTLGEGTTITLKLPLTLAIIDGLLVTIGPGHYVLPLSSVEECVELTRSESGLDKERHILNVRGEIVPYVPLRDEYEIEGSYPDVEQVVIMETNGKRIGFVVDEVIGGHQTVIKNLSSVFKEARDISGATILGDGSVALIVDVNKIMN